jgi:opacity protein-like surface antigen
MFKRLAIVVLAFACASAAQAADQVLWQIDLLPSGKAISRDAPVARGGSYLYHEYPSGTLISVKKSTVKQITKLSPAAAAAALPKNQVTSIRDLPMQGPKASGGVYRNNIGRARDAVSAANAGTSGRTASPE